MATVGERDRQRGSKVSRPRSDVEQRYRAREQRKGERAASGQRPKIEDATTIDEAMEAERAAGRDEGARSRTQRPVVRYGAGERVDAPKPPKPARDVTGALSKAAPAAGSGIPAVTAPMLIELGLITIDELVNERRFPVPSRLLVAFAFFGLLGMAKGPAAQPAAALGWGIVAATFYSKSKENKTDAGETGGPPAINALAALGDFFGGRYGTPSAATNVGPAPGPSPTAFIPSTSRNVGNTQKVS